MPKAGLFAAVFAAAMVMNFGPAEAKGDRGERNGASDDELRAWDRKIDDPEQRFEMLDDFHGQAVLDRETDLVWQQAPGLGLALQSVAARACPQLSVDNRFGWRLPTVQELATLVDPSVSPGPKVPAGHPFSNVGDKFWTNSLHPFSSSQVYIVDFATGAVEFGQTTQQVLPFWCVRGGIGSGVRSQ
jgi:hypothetical protein